jgi:hypothetical protein
MIRRKIAPLALSEIINLYCLHNTDLLIIVSEEKAFRREDLKSQKQMFP